MQQLRFATFLLAFSSVTLPDENPVSNSKQHNNAWNLQGLVELPYIAAQTLIFGLITYFMTNYERNLCKLFVTLGEPASSPLKCRGYMLCFIFFRFDIMIIINTVSYNRREIDHVPCLPVPYFYLLHILWDGGGRIDLDTTNGSSGIQRVLLLVESSFRFPNSPICKLLNPLLNPAFTLLLRHSLTSRVVRFLPLFFTK